MSPGLADLHYPPIQNGMDYLRSVVGLLDRAEPGPQELKYAVLHLQAATEVLLKALLAASDWRLVFTKPEEADQLAYQQGDFNSCKIDDAIKRLRALGVEISPEDKGNITHLAQQRNRLQHFGLTAAAPAIESRAAQVLDFLIAFVGDHLRPGVQGDDRQHLDREMLRVREALPRIRGYSTIIMDRIAPELAGREWYTLRCPDCAKWALLAEGGETRCLFCETDWYVEVFPLVYAVGVLGHSQHDYRKTPGGPAEQCPECGSYALIGEAYVAARPEEAAQYCFGCSTPFQGLETCMRCGRLFQPDPDDVIICNDCLRGLS
ncbi:hypothetical protein [Streptomyces acidiscabies]|uniref:DUF4145 domain-containing protein n=1 Tax=Streptomyces acidiscabies TaxID=42234 RepID=A0ABU4LYS7_9ACTN|nr:hypothetical protein [Streptomyces acidiscabies]MDX3020159.1 hypothetical protein [Streptomyces acidiscabies]